MNKTEVETLIKTAFKDIWLEGGSSLLQCQAMHERCKNVTPEEYKKLARQEITDDWPSVSIEVLEEYCRHLAHADAKAFRYYIPAMLMQALNGSWEMCSEIFIQLRPPKDVLREHFMKQFSLFDAPQRSAIAQFLFWLPEIVELDELQQKQCERTLQSYWHQFL